MTTTILSNNPVRGKSSR